MHFSLRLCVSLGLVVFALIWLLVVTNVPSLVKSDQMLITTSLVSGFCFGSICALLFMPVPPSPKFVVMFGVYVTVCASSAFVVLYIWRLWVKQENVTSLSSFFKIMCVTLTLKYNLHVSASHVHEIHKASWIMSLLQFSGIGKNVSDYLCNRTPFFLPIFQ